MARSGSLAEYKRRRDFAKTPEPAGRVGPKKGRSFVIQKHAATRLHYDFRLELDGVLKSWAVTKEPSFDPAVKRLAVRTEDHPLEYGTFEGTIPKGEYGGGTVMLWDRGTWEPLEGDPREGLKAGKLSFRLAGERLTGGWALVRMRGRPGEKRENWLLVKERDDEADGEHPSPETSVASGRTMDEIANGRSAVWHSNKSRALRADDPPAPERTPTKRARRSKAVPLPKFRPVELATLVTAPPEGADWLHELKYDGYRLLIAASGDDVRCYTRSGQDWTQKFRAITQAFQVMALPGALIDGEAVAFNAKGRSDFSSLQHALSEGGRIAFFAFDLLALDGADLTRLPLSERKQRLEALLSERSADGAIRFSTHIEGRGPEVFAKVCAAGEEGIVSKKASSLYRGERTHAWVKVKCTRRQEFVIGGWTPSEKRTGFRSLLLGVFEPDGSLRYVGRVGTGFDEKDLDSLGRELKRLAQPKPPFKAVPREAARRAKWAAPKLVAEIAFTEFTGDGILRHPSFLGLREDKQPREVGMEKPEPVEDAVAGDNETIVRAGIRITHPDRVVFGEQGLTKRDLADYYVKVAERMLPHLAKRPLSLVRCPAGSQKCFFQKHDTGGFPDAIKRMNITEATGGGGIYFYVTDLAGIIGCVQMGVMEFHIWGSRVDSIEKPDRLIFDLDPDVGLDFTDVRKAAVDVRDRLDALGLRTFPMVTGGKGIHVVAPIERRAAWPDVKAFAKEFAARLAAEAPDRYTANMAKAKRHGRIFVDYLRNERGATAITPYSTRARGTAPVAVPVTWEEAGSLEAANLFGVKEVIARLRDADPWADYFGVRQSITKRMLEKVAAA